MHTMFTLYFESFVLLDEASIDRLYESISVDEGTVAVSVVLG